MRAKMLVFLGISSGLILGAALCGCVKAKGDVAVTRSERTPESRTVVAGREEMRSPATAGEQRGRVTVVIATAPPLTRAEIPSHEPRGDEFWVAGNWRGESGQYVWQSGRIEHDRAGQLYVPANWVPSSRGWEYTPENWR